MHHHMQTMEIQMLFVLQKILRMTWTMTLTLICCIKRTVELHHSLFLHSWRWTLPPSRAPKAEVTTIILIIILVIITLHYCIPINTPSYSKSTNFGIMLNWHVL
eukprot:PhF_6_TR26173/c0_g1_i1/m.37174